MANSYQVTLTWPTYPNQGTITSLVVSRDGTDIATLPASATSFIDDGSTIAGPVLPLTTYTYSVTVNFNNGCPARALDAIVDVGCYATDAVNVALTAGADGAVFVSWEPPGTGLPFYGYTVKYGTTDGGPYPTSLVIADPLAVSATITGLTPGTTYYFVVLGMDQNNCASAGNNQPPGVPAEFYGISWEPSGADLPGLIGKFAFNNASNLGGVTSLTFSETTNREGYDLENAPDLLTVNFPNLISLTDGSYLQISGCSLLTTVTFSAFASSGTQSFDIDSNPLLTGVNGLNAGAAFNCNFTFSNCAAITFLDLAGAIFNFDAAVNNNPSLFIVGVSGVTITDTRFYNFSGNALTQGTVDGILSMAVANAGYVSGTIDLSGGTNSAPSGAGLVNAAILTGRGVTVIHN